MAMSPRNKDFSLDIVGSTHFGRYPKISQEQTFNMIISDDFLVPYAGYKKIAEISDSYEGRGIFTSTRFQHIIAVIGNEVYVIPSGLVPALVGTIDTYTGDVFIEENNDNQIAICDRQKIYIYNTSTGSFTDAGVDFTPGYISFQNGRFIAVDRDTNQWRLSEVGKGTSWPGTSQYVGSLQTKPDIVVGAQRFPGRGNLLYVFGGTVTESWQDAGLSLFPYRRNSSINMDYGCLSAATIAYNDRMMVWLAANEKSGPTLMYSTGGDPIRISTDGLDFKFSNLTNPSNSYGFLFQQEGHSLYQFTFPDDELTFVYDFNTHKFFSLADANMNAHIAKRVTYYNDKYFFISFKDGNIYELSTQFDTNDGEEIPRIRVCKNFRLPDSSRFVVNELTLTVEQGVQQEKQRDLRFQSLDDQIFVSLSGQEFRGLGSQATESKVMFSMSKNGGESFGNFYAKNFNDLGKYQNRLRYLRLGAANDFIPQFRFYGLGRFVIGNGIMSISK